MITPESDKSGAKTPTTSEDLGASVLDATPVSLAKVLPACFLAWALPGMGHVLLGRIGRGTVFAVIILGLFIGGLALEGKVYRPVDGEPLTYLAAIGAAGVGVPFLVAHYAGVSDGNLEGPYFDYGNTFTLVAGLLNLLVVLDAFDVASGRR